MADADFNINIRTLADLTGIKLTQEQLNALNKAAAAGNKEAIADLKKLSEAQKEAAASENVGFTRGAIGVGTIITLLTRAISQWRAFNDEQDRWVDGMIKAEEKARALGESILDMQDKAREALRIDTEPLYQSFIRLQQVIIRLKTEMNLLDLPTQGEEYKKLAADVRIAESALKGVTSELQKQEVAAEKLAEKNAEAAASFMKGAVQTAQPQVQAVLKNEEAARKAREAGLDKDADLYQKSANQLKASMTQAQREEYEGLTKPVRLGPKAGPGESQELVDEVARQKINFERQLRGEPPLPEGRGQGNQDIIDAMYEIWGR